MGLRATFGRRLRLIAGIFVLVTGIFVGAVPVRVAAFSGDWTSPLTTMPSVTAGFLANDCGQSGYGGYSVDNNYHIANDYGIEAGTHVFAIGYGNVVKVQSDWPGSAVFIKHTAADGQQFLAVYGHLENAVAEGATVSMGQQIGDVYDWGSNSHLHFGIRNATVPASDNNGNMPCSSWTTTPDTNGYVDPLPYLAAHPRVTPVSDSDGDGIVDSADQCPTAAGPAWRNGCPVFFSLTDSGMASGYFNNDAYVDIAIGAPGEGIGTSAGPNENAGNVHIAYGTASGPGTANSSRLMQGGYTQSDVVNLVGNSLEPDDVTGAALAAGDFNNDGLDDLAVGSPGETLAGQAGAGLVHVVYGTTTGLTSSSQQQVISQGGYSTTNSVNTVNSIEAGDYFGAELATGDLNGDGYNDLIIGVPGEDIGASGGADAGIVHVLYGSASGFGSSQNVISQTGYAPTGSVNTSGSYEEGDYFGAALATAYIDGDSKADLLIGVPGEDIGSAMDAGFVHLLYGSASGPVTTNQKLFAQGGYTGSNVVNLANSAYGTNDYLGATIATGYINDDMYPDLVIGAPGEGFGSSATAGAGAAFVIYNAAGAFATGNTQQLFAQQGVSGSGTVNTVAGSLEAGDAFGSSLAVGDVGGDGHDDVIVGVPGEGVGGSVYAGFVHVAFGSTSGIGSAQQVLAQSGYSGTNIVNLTGSMEADDLVGTDLLVASVNGDAKKDLLVAAPGEDLGVSYVDAGVVHLAYGGASGFSEGSGYQYSLSQSGYDPTTNIQLTGSIEAGDNFGGGQPSRLFW